MPILLLLLVLLLLAGVGYLYERRAEREHRRRFPPPGQMVDIGGYRLHLLSLGEKRPGQPVVILESGHGDWSVGWRRVQPEIARFARVCAYDRAGFGWSDSGPLPRTPVQVAIELHGLLERAGEAPPYLLVGHSLGGAFNRLFASLYPEEVAGMVWIDSAHEDMLQHIVFWKAAYQAILGATWLGSLLARLGLVRLLARRQVLGFFPGELEPGERALISSQAVTPGFFRVMREETLGWYPAGNWARTRDSFGSLPVVMLEAQYTPRPPRPYPARQWQQYLEGWRAIQADLSRRSARTRRIPVASGHVIQVEQPELVVQVIQEVLAEMAGMEPQASPQPPGAQGS